MRKILLLILICFAALISSDCKKKISKHPFEMEGVWCTDDLMCGKVLVIENNSAGRLFTTLDGFCFFTKDLKGKIKYKKDNLYIDGQRFEIIQQPEYASGNDSINAPDENDFDHGGYRMRKVLASMTIRPRGLMVGSDSYELFKYVDY